MDGVTTLQNPEIGWTNGTGQKSRTSIKRNKNQYLEKNFGLQLS